MSLDLIFKISKKEKLKENYKYKKNLFLRQGIVLKHEAQKYAQQSLTAVRINTRDNKFSKIERQFPKR